MVTTRWVLAFDAACCRCRALAREVEGHGGRPLEVLPLDHPEVRAWREAALGADPPHAPTLLRVPADGRTAPRAWTGPVMGVRLALRLGPRRTARLLRALGERQAGGAAPRGIARGRFLRLAGLGAAAAVLGGRPAAASDARPANPAEAWARAHRDRLPRDYDGISAHPLAYRRAIFAELDPADRTALWLEHLARYRAAHPALTAAQRDVLDRAEAVFRRPATFTEGAAGASRADLRSLRAAALAAFGREEGRAALATLGPAATAAEDGGCGCNCGDDWCTSACVCCVDGKPCWCTQSSWGCGLGFAYRCYGTCS